MVHVSAGILSITKVFADYNILTATSQKDLHKTIDTVVVECERLVPGVNNRRTDVMAISKLLIINVSFIYLGQVNKSLRVDTRITSDRRLSQR